MMIEGHKLYKLEALRGFAAIYVVFHHLFASGLHVFGKDFSILFRFGQEAVILFFILSGFVIYFSLEKSKDKSLMMFFSKRFLRIYIPLIFVFIANYLLFCFYNKSFIAIDINELLGNLLMLQDLKDKRPDVIVSPFLGNIPLWSLSYEWYFYFMFFFVFKKGTNSSLLVYFSAVIAAVLYVFYPSFIFRLIMYFAIWWTGVDFAKFYIGKKEISFNSFRIILIALLSISSILIFNVYYNGALNNINRAGGIGAHPWLELRHFVFTIVVVGGAIVWKKINWIGFDFIFKPFVYVAPISFGIYISHWFLLYNHNYLNFIENTSLRLISAIIVCIVFSYLLEIKLFPKVKKMIL
ncbi:acyltransferase family protein [Flavobacterium flavipallidum]|uniref:Acyltransferase n=1 Tax=Flavobacterium flavipallidum TaxID=3139140 RepID=A0ABU9HJ24_9FLAO